MDVSTYIIEGGWAMYVILLLQFPALFLGIGSLGWAWMRLSETREDNRVFLLPAITFAFGLFVLAVGFVGWQMALSAMEQAITPDVIPKEARAMRREGQRLASYPLYYGTLIGLPTMIAGIMSGFMAFRRPT